MQQFLAVRDPDAKRRTRCLRELRDCWSADDDQGISEMTKGDVAVLYSRGYEVPPSTWQSNDHAGLIVGLAFEDSAGQRLDAAQLAERWAEESGALPPPLEGYHVGIVASKHGRLVIGADPLGLYPVYWWQGEGCLVVASSPESIGRHPAFQRALSRQALAGILLTQHLVENRALWEGVRRLRPGHLLVSGSGQAAREVRQYEVPFSEDSYDLPFSAQVEAMGDVMAEASRRQLTDPERTYLLLSGGLDSRTVAGFTAEMQLKPAALTFGRPGEIEMECAQAVTRTLGWRHESYEVTLDQLVSCAVRHARWTHLSGGFNSTEYWQTAPVMRAMGPYFATGMVMDPIIGGTHITWGFDRQQRKLGFDPLFRTGNRYGVPQSVLHDVVVDKELRDAIEHIPDALRRQYAGYAERDFQRVWLYDLMHRQRFHTGTFLWLLSFGSCPVMPAVDSRVLRFVAGLPAASLAERRAQVELVKLRFPHLAELPLDRNSHNDMPLSPRLRDLVTRGLRSKAARYLPKLNAERDERRYYFRLYDFNSAGWKAVRAEAEASLKYLDGLFDMQKLRTYLPPPETDLQVDDAIIDTSGRKLLIGLALWAREHL